MESNQTFQPDPLNNPTAEPAINQEPPNHSPMGHVASHSFMDSGPEKTVFGNFAPPSQPDPPAPLSSVFDNPDRPSDEPVAVVRVLSTRGVEYGMMSLALWIAASTMAWVVLNMLNGSGGFNTLVVPTSSLVICLPVFGLFFLRLKKAELANPQLRLDPSKRRWSQTTQFLAYIVLLVNFIYFVYTILQHASGGKAPSIGKSLVNLLVILVIAGGVLLYYWRDEHRTRKS
jgi:hypothetical protein